MQPTSTPSAGSCQDLDFFPAPRNIWDDPVFAREPFTEREAWLWMISAAAWKPIRVRSGNAIVDLARGEFAYSLRFMATRFRWSEPKVRRFLGRLKTNAMALVRATRETTIVSICDYSKYDVYGRSSDATTDALTDAEATQIIKEDLTKKDLSSLSISSEEKESSLPASPDRRAQIVFESGIIRLNQADFDKWESAFPHIDLRAELLALTDWANEQGKAKWFWAVPKALKNANQKAKERAQRARSNGQPDPNNPNSYWDKSV